MASRTRDNIKTTDLSNNSGTIFEDNVIGGISAADLRMGLTDIVDSAVFRTVNSNTDPTASNDASNDYQIGDIWVNEMSDDAFICVDNTTGSAIWTNVSDSSGSGTTITGAASTIATSDLTASRTLISNASGKVAVSAVTDTELGYLGGVTSSIQTQLDAKISYSNEMVDDRVNALLIGGTNITLTYDDTAGTLTIDATASGGTTITGGASTIATADLTASRALISNASGKVAVSTVSTTELGYLDGVTSDIQTQLDAKSTFSGSYNDLSNKPSIPGNTEIDARIATYARISPSGTIAAAQIPNLNASKINAGTFDADRIPGLDAAKITGGTIADARIPASIARDSELPDDTDDLSEGSSNLYFTNTRVDNRIATWARANSPSGTIPVATIPDLAASKITSGTFADAQIPSLGTSKITSGTFDVARIPDLAANKITSGTISIARLGTSGTRSSSNILYGDNVWRAAPSGSGGTTAGTPPREITGSGNVYTLTDDENIILVELQGDSTNDRNFTVMILRAELSGTAKDYLADSRNPASITSDGDERFFGFTASISGNNVTIVSGNYLGTIEAVYGLVSGAKGAKGDAGTTDYNLLANKPTIPAAQIQSDWTQSTSSALDFIKNKPSIPGNTEIDARVATWARANSPSGTVPSARLSLTASDIPNLGTAKITSGTFDAARIPSLNASKINAGTFAVGLIPDLDAAKITSGTIADARIPTSIARDSEIPDAGNGLEKSGGNFQIDLDGATLAVSSSGLKLADTVARDRGAYDSTSGTYVVGDIVSNSGTIYRCKTAITTSETFTASKWDDLSTVGTSGTTITGAASTIATSDLTASRALISNASGKVAVSTVTDTELGFLDGVTSSIQTQLDAKSTFDGTYAALTGTKPPAGAEVNVQANWTEADTNSDAFIQNKPTIPSSVSLTQVQQIGLLRFDFSPAVLSYTGTLQSALERQNFFRIEVSNPDVLTGDIWVEGTVGGQSSLSRTKWTSTTTILTLPVRNANAATIASGLGTGSTLEFILTFYDAASSGNSVEALRLKLPVVHRLGPFQPVDNEAAYDAITTKVDGTIYYWTS